MRRSAALLLLLGACRLSHERVPATIVDEKPRLETAMAVASEGRPLYVRDTEADRATAALIAFLQLAAGNIPDPYPIQTPQGPAYGGADKLAIRLQFRDAVAGFGVLLLEMPYPREDDVTFTAPNFACDYFTHPSGPVASLEAGWVRVRGATSGHLELELYLRLRPVDSRRGPMVVVTRFETGLRH